MGLLQRHVRIVKLDFINIRLYLQHFSSPLMPPLRYSSFGPPKQSGVEVGFSVDYCCFVPMIIDINGREIDVDDRCFGGSSLSPLGVSFAPQNTGR